ncbi:unnamed protein product [Fusarium graminearum]|nr:unnamed protein product [Fusarium graminearum]
MNPEELAHLAAMGLPAPTNVTPSMRQGIRDRADSLWGPTLNVSPEAYARRRDQSRRLQLARDQGHGPKRRKLPLNISAGSTTGSEGLPLCDLSLSVGWWEYTTMKQEKMEAAERTRFKRGRRQHKLMQRWQNSLARRFGGAPHPTWKPPQRHKWVVDRLRAGKRTQEWLSWRESMASLAEETAIYAIEQAETHCWLLENWPYGYADRARREAIE